ncbi:MAG TPA: dihydroxy-acid dehydratase, partial [Hyphomicrobiaceae bacterium]|nr:dihydroxy-acid dehydratase [Hyphomicrobiaceae bacterium]
VAPEAAVGGPLGLVRTGDRICLSVRDRRLDLLVEEKELERRRHSLSPAGPNPALRGYDKLFRDTVLQAPDGCDLDFLRG